RKFNIVVFGAHPDDPETGCGGLIATLSRTGHSVVCAYGTSFRRNQRYAGMPEKEIREEEARQACAILGAKPCFFPWEHDELVVCPSLLNTVQEWIKSTKPDIVLAHWPFDSHPHHHAISSLVWQAYLKNDAWKLYFYEVMAFEQTIGFRPDLYLDIAAVHDIKKQAVFCHQSQSPETLWCAHEAMHRMRGAECGVECAEAFFAPDPRKHNAFLPVPLLRRLI
nr:PIG-L family deacetylase [Candidatus Hydrogenedentota bacterium]